MDELLFARVNHIFSEELLNNKSDISFIIKLLQISTFESFLSQNMISVKHLQVSSHKSKQPLPLKV